MTRCCPEQSHLRRHLSCRGPGCWAHTRQPLRALPGAGVRPSRASPAEEAILGCRHHRCADCHVSPNWTAEPVQSANAAIVSHPSDPCRFHILCLPPSPAHPVGPLWPALACPQTPGYERYGVKVKCFGKQIRIGSRFQDVESAAKVANAFKEVGGLARLLARSLATGRHGTLSSLPIPQAPLALSLSVVSHWSGAGTRITHNWRAVARLRSVSSSVSCSGRPKRST